MHLRYYASLGPSHIFEKHPPQPVTSFKVESQCWGNATIFLLVSSDRDRLPY